MKRASIPAGKKSSKKCMPQKSVACRKAKKSRQAAGLSREEKDQLVLEFRIKARKLGRSILRKWHARLDLQEVDSVVDLSLCEAVKTYDPRKGASFITFLYYHLRGNLIRAVSAAAQANTIPYAVQGEDADAIAPAEGQLSATANDIAEALTSHDSVLPDEVFFKKQLELLSADARLRLDPLEREVIERIYIKEQQLMDIATELGYSRCHISRVKKKALDTLQSDLTACMQSANPDFHGEALDAAEVQTFQRTSIQRRKSRQNLDGAESAGN